MQPTAYKESLYLMSVQDLYAERVFWQHQYNTSIGFDTDTWISSEYHLGLISDLIKQRKLTDLLEGK